jgi:adenylate kinase family enzyme
MPNIIFLFGPSCSGKSTLGEALQNDLGSEWTYIDRDDLIEQNVCTDSAADNTLEERIQSIKNKIIINAQIPWRDKRKGELYFMLLPPLEVLLNRDAERAKMLQRSERQAYYARQFVLETYNILSNMNRENFNHCFDSSQESVIDEINMIKNQAAPYDNDDSV